MNNAFAIDYKLSELLESSSTFDTEDFFNKFPGEPSPTIYSRIRTLINKGIIHRIGRGKYSIGKSKYFRPSQDSFTGSLQETLKGEFPYSDFLIWRLSWINHLFQHLVDLDITFIDIDRECVESLYWFLKGKGYNVVTRKRMFDDLAEYKGFVILRPLVTSAPKLKTETVQSPAIEKILVDVACDKEFESFQGSEILHLFENAFNEYSINIDTLLRYADRKGKRTGVLKLINEIKRQ